jgi:hypothetical protein
MSGHTSQGAPRNKAGGFAALYLALAYVVAMPYFLLISDYKNATTSAEKVTSILTDYQGLYAMYLLSYVFFGIVLGILVLSLFDRLREHGELAARVATAVGLTWSVALVLSGMVFDHGMGTVVSLAHTSPQQAAATWQAIEPVSDGLAVGTGETLGGLWMLIVCWIALRGRVLSRPLSWFGVATGLVGLASTVPALNEGAIAFGLLQIVWFAWLGITLLVPKVAASRAPIATPSPGVA